MPRVKISSRNLDRLTSEGKVQLDWWDTQWRHPGSFGLRVARTGTKTWTYLETSTDGRKRHSLGRWPEMSRDEALARAQRLARQHSPGAMLVSELAERMMRKLEASGATPSTVEQRRSNLKLYILPKLGKLRVPEVTTGMCQQLVDDAELDGQPGRARNTQSTLRVLFADVVRLGQHDYNPARDVRCSRATMTSRRRSVTATLDTIARVWRACEAMEPGPFRQHSLALRVQIATAQRSRVVLQMHRDHVTDWWDHPGLFTVDGSEYRTKSGRPMSVWISPRIRALLDRAAGGEWMFWQGSPERSWRGDFLAEVRERAGLELDDWRPHDVRAVCATTLDRAGVPLDHFQRLLDHTRPRSVTTLHYVRWRERDPVVRQVQEAWDAHLNDALASSSTVATAQP